MRRTRENPEVHAGSMADIAFLLLIFFLVTTTIQTDVGLDRKLPPDIKNQINIHERNILRISLNKNDELLVEDEVMNIDQLKSAAKKFLDNGGELANDKYCDYCQGDRNPASSDNPQQAIVSFSSDRSASYGMYVRVQDQLAKSYHELRNREAQRLFGQDYVAMEKHYYAPETPDEVKRELKSRIESVREMFPMNISEAELNVSSKNQTP